MIRSASGTFRRLLTLEDGARLLLRPLTADDCDELIQMYASAPPEDLQALHENVADPQVVRGWVQAMAEGRVLPLLALINSRIVGNAMLYRFTGPYQHLGEVQIFLTKEFRGRGLGTEMLKTLIDLARKEGLHLLKAEGFASQPKVIRAFEQLGFERQCVLEDYFMLPDGQTKDIVLLHMRLLQRKDEF
jgi:L-amino acid N-acyltransferase YncA